MSSGWIYLISSLAGAAFGHGMRRGDPPTVGLGIACGVACGFVYLEQSPWPLLPAALLALATFRRRR